MKKFGKILFALGSLLIVLSLVLLVFMQANARKAEAENERIVQIMESILTDRRAGSAGETGPMPVLNLQGEDYVALLEIPAYGLKLPVGNVWDSGLAVSHPCRFDGSAYDGSLVIGGFDQAGQFDFFDRISDGAKVILTDMTGCTFTYEVARVDRADSAEAGILMQDEAALTLFVRDSRLLQYIIIRCVT